MKIAVVGAGAIGGYLGARLAAAGDELTFIARGEQLAALRERGITLIDEHGEELHVREVRALESLRDAGAHDAVLLTLKAHQVGAVAPDLESLCHAGSTIVTMQNGIPWWYFYHHGGEHAGYAIRAADPGGAIARHIDPARVIGSVVYPAAVSRAPGVVQVVEGDRFTLGELDGATTPRIQELAAHLTRAKLKVRISADVRTELWLKLWGNLSFNPISALSHATLVEMCQFPATRALAASMMREAEQIANKLGVTFKLGIERRIAGAEKVGAHKTSMLQDIEQGRPLELEALLGAVIELGVLTSTPTPHLESIYAVASLLAKTLHDRRGTLRIAEPPQREAKS
jgi:2-dehydropantoate 2-reductase